MILERISSAVWGNGLITLLLLTGAFFTVKLGAVQLKMFPYLFRNRSTRNNGLSQIKTVCMSLGTAMGTGNITGVAAALSVGGAGAVFWMWISAFFGMALVYAENTLSVIYSNSSCRGPMAYISRGLRSRTLAVIFAVLCLFAAFGMGGMVQVSSFTASLRECTHVSGYILIPAVFILIFIITSGGASRIGLAAQALLPLATVSYTVICIAVLIKNRSALPATISSIFSEAFGMRQAAGGTFGTALSVGIRRGIFSNEAGLGSSPILHSAAESDCPETQGMWSMFEVFFDTVICCTVTALTILCCAEDCSIQTAFSCILGENGKYFITAELGIFAFCTIIGWYYCAETAFRFITGSRYTRSISAVFAAVSALGAVLTVKTVWTLSDIFNGLMAFPNLLALLLLSKYVKNKPRKGGQ